MAPLFNVLDGAGAKAVYTYDFGDSWKHRIAVEKVLPPEAGQEYPVCVAVKRHGPPDDCGGIWGYAELVEVLRDPADQEHEERLEWLGLDDAAEFDPERFDAEAVTRALSFAR